MDGRLQSLVLDASAEELEEIRNYASQTPIKPYFYDSLHRNKVSGLFLERLIELGFASPEGDWLGMDRSVLALYMTELATTMSQKIQAPLVTSSPGYASIANASAFGRRWLEAYKDLHTGQFDEVTALVEMNVGFPSPADVAGCSMSEILEFRRVHCDEMRQFRKTVEETLAGVAGCTDKNAVQDFLRQSSQDFKVAQKQFERSLLAFGIDKLGDVLKFDFKGPALLIVAGSVLHAPAAIAIGGGAVVCGIQAFLKYREQRDASPYSYLLTLKTLRE